MRMIYHVGSGARHTVSVDVDDASSRVRLSVDGRVELDKQVTDSLEHEFSAGGPDGGTLRLAASLVGWQLNANLYADGRLLQPLRAGEAAAAEPRLRPPSAAEPMLPAGMSGGYRIHSPKGGPVYERKWDWGNPAAITCLVLAVLCVTAMVVLVLFLPAAHRHTQRSRGAAQALGLLHYLVMVAGAGGGIWLLLAIGIARKLMWCAVVATTLVAISLVWRVGRFIWIIVRLDWKGAYFAVPLLLDIVGITVGIIVLALIIKGIGRIRERS